MKKTFLFMSLLLGLIVCAMVVTSCGDDEDDGGDISGDPTVDTESLLPGALNAMHGIEGKEGYRITNASEWKFTYRSNGTLQTIGTSSSDFLMTTNPFVLSDGDEENTYKFFFNSKGYVSKVLVSEENGHYNGTALYTYNSDDQLKLIKYKLSGRDGTYIIYDENYETSFSYSMGKLVKVDWKFSCKDELDGEIEYYNDESNAVFEYHNARSNIYSQYTDNIVDIISEHFTSNEDNYVLPTYYLGMFGKGSAMHPTSITLTYDEDEIRNFMYSYEFNSEGAVFKVIEKDVDNGHTYTNNYNYTWTNGTRAFSEEGSVNFVKDEPRLSRRLRCIRRRLHK